MTVRDLTGPWWTVREALGETWRWYVDAPLDEWHNNVATAADRGRSAPGWWPATVPGSVVTDLWRAGELPDPYRGRNSRAAEWTGDRSWVYRRAVDLPALADDEWAVLEFDGIDPSGTVFWDGRPLGRVPGLYRSARFSLPADAAAPGPHRLAVVVDPVPPSQPQVGRTELVRTHRPRMTEGWDFCPRLPHQGIWRDVRLVVGAAQLATVSVTARLDASDNGVVTFTGSVETSGDRPVPADVTLLDTAGRVVAADRVEVTEDFRVDLTIPEPELWWPRGFGAPTTYTARLCLAGAAEPAWQGLVGFRRATLVANAGAPAPALGYTALVNDTVVPLVGWNWVPADAQYGSVDPERVRHLVDLAARSGARILRIWGGGLVETEEFYAACDRAGLLVWQEFSQSSSGMQSAPATDAEFVALMAEEAAAVVPARAHHPSLLVWGGGNELDADGVPLTEERSPVLTALRDTVRRLDPDRAWLPTSPSGPVFHNRLDVIAAAPGDQHDVHGPWEHQGPREQYTLANAGTSLAHTEFGVEGMTNRRVLDHLLPEADRWPADRTNPAYRHLGDWWINTPLVQESFGHRLTDLDAVLRASQLLQATGLAYAVEADRRRFPACSMVLPWQLNESYPNAFCTSCVDHRGEPKPAFHAVARAFAPRRVTARVPTSVWAGAERLTAQPWVWADRGVGSGSRVSARLLTADGTVLGERRWRIDDPVRHPRPVGTIEVTAADVPGEAVVVWDLRWESADGQPIDREAVLACTGADFAPLLDLPAATLDVRAGGGGVEVTHRAGPTVVGLRVVDDRPVDAPGWLVADGDPRPLLPGETRTFAVHHRPPGGHPEPVLGTAAGAPSPAAVRVEAWNTEPVTLDLPGTLDLEDQ
ncbi:glycoside hydrolase family 2 protein [Plantactinospora sp. GCM10030261]|uniref:glycoside hydrolase family 2 protein n=1 Tax=Plantactinospora sp. GCM10030261 TaxID=3273420 RepID=UPI003606B04F